MTPPPSQPPVSVEETENGYIVHAGSAVATISKTILGYAVDADSQVLKEEYDLSPGVTQVRKSARDTMQFSADPTDDTRLILRAKRVFLVLSQAVEMVCGFRPEHFPREDEWKLLTSWKSERDVPAEPEIVNETDVAEEKTDTEIVPESTKTSQENSRDSNVVSRKPSKSYSPLVIELHREVSQLKRYQFSHSIPFTIKNGIILVFEEGEKYQNYDRIVYVGIHTAPGHLQQRVQSFLSGTKDGVILRKNIGTALLSNSPYQKVWQGDSSSEEKREKFGSAYNPTMQKTIEEQVSRYISSKMTYAIIKVEGLDNRKEAQKALVATLKDEYSRLLKFDKWQGSSHPSPNIHQTGLWQDSKYPGFSFHEDILKRVFENIRASSEDNDVNSSSAESKKTETLQSKNLPELRQKLSVNDVKKPSMAETLFWKRVADFTSQSSPKTQGERESIESSKSQTEETSLIQPAKHSTSDREKTVTVSLLGKSYVVSFRNVAAKITPLVDGYSLENYSQIFNIDGNISDKIRTVREAIRLYHSLWKEVDTTAEVLTIHSPFVFPHISDALETICGYKVRDVPSDGVFQTLSSWIGFIDDGLKDEPPVPQIRPKETPSFSSDTIGKTYYSWTVLTPNKVRKIVDKSCLEYHGSAIPTDVRSFFNVDNMKIGDTQLVNLFYNGEYHTGKITSNAHGRVRLFWSQELSEQLHEYCNSHPEGAFIIFEKRRKTHNYSFSFENEKESRRKTPAVSPLPSVNKPKPESVNEPKVTTKSVTPQRSINEPRTEYVNGADDEFLKEAVIIDDCFVKKITQTVVTSKKIVLPPPCLPFFDAEDMKSGEARRITIKYDGKEGQAQIYKNNASKGKYAHSTAITWNDALNAYIKQMTRDEVNEMYIFLEKSILDDDTYRLRIEKIS